MLNAWMRGFTIRFRMIGAIGVVVALLTAIGGFGLWQMARTQHLSSEFLEHSFAEAGGVADLQRLLGELRRHEKDLVIYYEQPEAVALSRLAWDGALQSTEQAFAALLEGEEDEDNPLARGAIDDLKAYRAAFEPVIAQIQAQAYDTATVVDRVSGKAKAAIGEAESKLAQIDGIVKAEAEATQAELAAQFRAAMLGFGTVLLFAVLVVVPLTLVNMHSIVRPIAHARKIAQAIAGGDLTVPVRPEGRDEASELLASLDAMQTALRQIVGEVRQSADAIGSASREVATGNADLSTRTEHAAGQLQQTASAMSQITGTVRQSGDAATQANQLAHGAAEVARRGGEVVSGVVSTMGEISASSQRIADIIGTIDGIAFQTNILALNAAVEAARAGEQGRGFAVVASEVRSLAQRSAEAAREIKALIGASVDKVEAGSRLVGEAGSTMTEIVASVQRVTDIIGEISSAAGEQTAGIGQVNGAVVELDRMTQQNAALVEQSAAAAESLQAQAQRLGQVVERFRLDTPV
ncbi:MAG: HAMP domain-containing protein [Burkholderiaceae bacterium]|nr:HAMP domain-containing protein [Burkholderiaceae bacterium]